MDWLAKTISIRLTTAALLAAVLTACGSSGGNAGSGLAGSGAACDPGDASTADACGTVVLALTDVEGDFTSYTVDVLSVSLERATGTRVELLPQTTRIDFAQLTSLSELVSSASVVPGNFVGGRIRLDYSDAEIFVEAGNAIVAAEVYDADGHLLTADTPDSIVEVDIRLPDTDRLIVTRGTTSMLSIDFDLAASHLVDTTMDPVTAVAQPYLVAEVQPVDEKQIRVRGSLVDVDTVAGTYDIQLRPWYHRNGNFGVVTVYTNDSTLFEIDGVDYQGSDGLDALALQDPGILTVAYGALTTGDQRFTAEIVHAGDSVEGKRYSAVLGNIVSRNGDRLVIKGGIAIRKDRRAHFQRTVVVDIGPETRVSKEGFPDAALDISALSVGQRTLIFGEFALPAVDNADRFGPDIALVLDATQGKARMLATRLTGSLASATTGSIEIRLRAIDRLSAEMFDFSGTGITPDLDADPTSYEVSTATLPVDALVNDRPVRVFGFVTPFGAAPPDFEGRVLIGPQDLPAKLGISWGITGTPAPFSVMGAGSLVVDLGNPDIGLRHHMLIGYELIDLFDLAASPSLVPSGSPRVYGIWEPGHVELFKGFADFVDELALRLSNSDRARSLAAYGRYTESGNSLTSSKIVVYMTPATNP